MLMIFPQPLGWASLTGDPRVRCCWRSTAPGWRCCSASSPPGSATSTPITQSIVQLMFFLTPIVWIYEDLLNSPNPASPSGRAWPSSTRSCTSSRSSGGRCSAQDQHLRHWVVVLVITVVGLGADLRDHAALPGARGLLGLRPGPRGTTSVVSIATHGRVRRLPDLRRQEPVAEEDRPGHGRRQHRQRRPRSRSSRRCATSTLDLEHGARVGPGRPQRRRQVDAAAAAGRHLRADPRHRRGRGPGRAGVRPRRRHGPGDLRLREHHHPRPLPRA